MSRTSSSAAAALVAFTLTFVITPSAPARTSYAQVGFFGNASANASAAHGEFTEPQRVAVAPPGAPGEGDIYVADTGNHRIEVFKPAGAGPCGSSCGTFVTEFGATELSEPVGVAVDPETGAVYVLDGGLSDVVKYDRTAGNPPTFAKDAAFKSPPHGTGNGEVACFGSSKVSFGDEHLGGIAVDPDVDSTNGGHDILIADPCKTPGEIERFTSAGAFVEEWDGSTSGEAFHKPTDLAVSSAGDVIVADLNESVGGSYGSFRFLRFSGTGAYKAPPLEGVPNPYASALGAVVGSDVETGEAFVSSATFSITSPGQVYDFDAANSLLDYFGAENDGFSIDFGGIATSATTTDRLYVLARGTVNGIINDVPRVQVYESSAYPEVTIEAVKLEDLTPVKVEGTAGATGYETTFKGTVDPSGGTLTVCRFEYVTQAAYEESGYEKAQQAACEPSASQIGKRNEVVDVHAKVGDLQAATSYHLRLVASNGGLREEAEAATFATAALPPAIQIGSAWSVTDSSATLVTAIDPNNAEVGDCHFEYGTTTSYGHAVPCTPAMPGSGHSFVQVIANVEGLAANTTYHFRLVASNTCASGCGTQSGEDATFTTRAPIVFPERHFELVSLFDNNGVWTVPIEASTDGDHYAYTSEILPFPGTEEGSDTPMVASRVVQPDGTVSWQQQYVGAPYPSPGEKGGAEPGVFSADLAHVAWSTNQGVDPADANHAADIYLRNVETGKLSWLSCMPAPPATACPPPAGSPSQTESGEAGEPLYVSPDGSRVIFTSERHLLPGDNVKSGRSLYEWHEGRLSLVGVRPSTSEGFEAGSMLGSLHPTSGNATVYGNPVSLNAVSRDGSRVVFQTGSNLEDQRLFVRIDGEHTVEASAPALGAAPLNGACKMQEGASDYPIACDVAFWGADENDENLFFSSASPLTEDSSAPGTKIDPEHGTGGSADLYRYIVPADGNPAHGQLVDLTPESTHPGESGAGVTQVLWVSNDGHRVYFMARAALMPDAKPAAHCDEQVGTPQKPGACNLYLAELGAPSGPAKFTLIATGQILLGGNQEGEIDYEPKDRQVSSNADGSVLAFRSSEALVPGQRTGGRQQVYVYDAVRHELDCASCTHSGSPPPRSWAGLTPAEEGGQPVGSLGGIKLQVPHVANVASDGTVFFETASSLSPENGGSAMDVYEWRGGRVHLLSQGASGLESYYGGASEDGSSVFIASFDQLVRGVEGGTTRIYVARVGPAPPEALPEAPCTGEDCKAPATPQPEPLTPGSFGLFGPGNLVPTPAHKGKEGKAKLRHKSCSAKFKHVKNAKRRRQKVTLCLRHQHKAKASGHRHSHRNTNHKSGNHS